MVFQEIDINSGEPIAACVSREQLPAGALVLVSPDDSPSDGKRAWIQWDHPITTPDEAAAWTARMRRAADPTYVMAYQPDLGVYCEIPIKDRKTLDTLPRIRYDGSRGSNP